MARCNHHQSPDRPKAIDEPFHGRSYSTDVGFSGFGPPSAPCRQQVRSQQQRRGSNHVSSAKSSCKTTPSTSDKTTKFQKYLLTSCRKLPVSSSLNFLDALHMPFHPFQGSLAFWQSINATYSSLCRTSCLMPRRVNMTTARPSRAVARAECLATLPVWIQNSATLGLQAIYHATLRASARLVPTIVVLPSHALQPKKCCSKGRKSGASGSL